MLHVLASVLRWFLTVFLGLCAIVYFPSASSVVFLVAAVLTAPIGRLSSLLGAIFKKGWVKGVAVAALFLLGAMIASRNVKPQNDAATDAPKEVMSQDADSKQASADTEAVNTAELTQKTKVLEYSTKTVDVMDLVSCSDESVAVKPVKGISLDELGSQTAVFELTRGDAKRSVELAFEVKDTHAPSIKTKEDYVVVDHGAKYDPASNVMSVSDPVDGDAERLREEPASSNGAWYVVKGDVDTARAGEYPVSVVACDANGNRKTKDFTVVVESPPEPEPAPEPEPDPEPSQSQTTNGATDTTGGENPFPDQGLPPATTAYVLNKRSKKFHRPSCQHVKKMAAHNREDVDDTRENILAQGYEPCKTCQP